MSTPKAVLFDLDGTLVDSNRLHVDAWAQAFAEAGYDISAERIAGQIGKGADNLVPTLLPDADAATADQLGETHGRIFKERHLDRVQPLVHARDLLARVHATGAKVILASSASKAELDHYIELLDARDLIDAGTSIDDVATSKPAPDIFATALKKAGVSAGEAVAVGDSPFDVEAADKAGIATIALRSGGFSDDALADAVAIYDDVAALLAGFDGSPLA